MMTINVILLLSFMFHGDFNSMFLHNYKQLHYPIFIIFSLALTDFTIVFDEVFSTIYYYIVDVLAVFFNHIACYGAEAFLFYHEIISNVVYAS